MTSQDSISYLPVPEFHEQSLNHSSKLINRKDDSLRNKQPPKAPKQKYRNRESGHITKNNTSQPLLISFRDSLCLEDEISYDNTSSTSYFEQTFETLSKLGEGSFGEVFKVRSKDDGYLYAVKKSKTFCKRGSIRDERLEEVKRYEQFSHHDRCVTLYKAWEQDNRLYMQMELCEGSLEHYLLRKTSLPENEIWSILLDMLTALKNLHDHNLIHLDIKLDNILVGDDGKCKLGDFGLVIDVDRANQYQATEGDSRYIAPELLLGHFSKAADIFSLGIAMLELSCNLELPPNGLLWQSLRNGNLPEEFINQISVDLQKIIKTMMAPNPLHRPTVTDLLLNPKLLAIQKSRQNWKILKKITTSFRQTKKYLSAKICKLKMAVYRLFFYVLISIQLTKKKPNLNNSDSSSSNENFSEFSQTQTPKSMDNNKFNNNYSQVFNSTPLHRHCYSQIYNNHPRDNFWLANDHFVPAAQYNGYFDRRNLKSDEMPEHVVKKLFTKHDCF